MFARCPKPIRTPTRHNLPPIVSAGRKDESGAGAHALQNLAANRSCALNAKRRGVRNASSALARKAGNEPSVKFQGDSAGGMNYFPGMSFTDVLAELPGL